MKSFEDKYPTLHGFKYDLESLVEERHLMQLCIEEVIVELQGPNGSAENALKIIKLYRQIEIVSAYFDEFENDKNE